MASPHSCRSTNKNIAEMETDPQPPRKPRGPKQGSKIDPKIKKKPLLRGMGIAKLELALVEEERMGVNPNDPTEPVYVLPGCPSYAGGPTMKPPSPPPACSQRTLMNLMGGVGEGRKTMLPPINARWGFFKTNPNEFPSNPNRYRCYKKKHFDGNGSSVVQSNGDGFANYAPYYPPPPPPPPPPSPENGYYYPITNHMEPMEEEYGSISPRDGEGSVKMYDFFPVKPDSISVDDESPNASTIDLSLKL